MLVLLLLVLLPRRWGLHHHRHLLLRGMKMHHHLRWRGAGSTASSRGWEPPRRRWLLVLVTMRQHHRAIGVANSRCATPRRPSARATARTDAPPVVSSLARSPTTVRRRVVSLKPWVLAFAKGRGGTRFDATQIDLRAIRKKVQRNVYDQSMQLHYY